MRSFVTAAFFALVTVTGCQPAGQSNTVNSPELTQLRQNIARLDSTLANQATRIAAQASEISTLKFQLEMMQDKTVMIDVSTTSYQCIDTNTARFLIVCDNVQPYADGQKLTFRIGNPNFVTFSGFKLQAKWGRAAPPYPGQSQQPNAYETWIAQNAQWQRSLHEKEIDSVAVLRPGVWNSVDVILSPAKAEDLRYLAVSMTTDQIALMRDKPK